MAKTKFGKWLEKTFNIGHHVRDSLKGTDFEGESLGTLFAKWFERVDKKILDTGMTQGQIDRSNTELNNQRILNEEEYDRKIDFYERFESPEAQVRQYKNAGLNPALLFGSGASVSASGGVGSAGDVSQPSQAGDGLGAILSSILGVMQFGLQSKTVKSEIAQRRASTVAQEIQNEYTRRMNDLEIRKREQDLEKGAQDIEINVQTLRKIVAEADFAEIYATFAPDLFQNQLDLGESERNFKAAQSRLADSNASLNEERKKEISSIISRNDKEKQLIDANISKIREELAFIASQTSLNTQAVEESKQRVKNMQEELVLTGKKIGLVQKDIEWYANNHTEVVNVNNDGPVQTVTFKDNKGAYTVAADGKIIYNRPYQPNVNSKGKRK